MIKFTEYVVNNSITNTLSDDKFDVDKPFNFIEYLNYVKVIDNNDLENFNQYKKYLEKWKNTDFENNKDNALNIKAIYKNFFNDLTLKYSTQEQRRFFNTIDLDDDDSLTKIIPFYRDKIVEILNYYRQKRNTFQRELREKQSKGSNLSVKDQIRNNIANFFTSPDYTGDVVSLSSLRIDVELGYDTFNDYFDVNPDTVDVNETYITNDINTNAFLDIDKALVQVLNDNNITLTELNPYKLVVEFNEVNTSLLQRDDFIDYKITTDTDTYRVLYEAELAEHLVGTDYYYLSTTETNYVSGRLFEAKNKAKNFFNINFASTLAKEKPPTGYERDIGLYFNPTKFSILRVDGEYIRKIKPELKDNFVYVFPDPNQYGDIINLSNTKRDNPFNFYFDKSSYKNISSSSSRTCVKADERNHYFHSYETVENRRINITNNGTFTDSITDLTNYGSIDKIESDIYGNEYIQFITNKGVIKNSSDITVIQDAAFESGNTVDISENRYGNGIEQLSGFSDKVNSFKKIYIKDVVNKNLVPLSASDFKTIYDKFKFNNTLYNQIINSDILDINVYDDTFSFDLSTYSIIDTFKYDGNFIEQVNTPLIIKRDVVNPDLSFITKDCHENNSIYKFNISLSGENLSSNNTFYYELYRYDTSKKIIDEISTRNTEPSSYFLDTFSFNFLESYGIISNIKVSLTKIINSELNYNSYDNSFILTTTFLRKNNSIAIHYFNYKIINNKVIPLSNDMFTNFNDSDISSVIEEVTSIAQLPGSFNFLTGGSDLIIPSLSFPVDNFDRTITFAYSGTKNINFDLQNIEQSSNGLSLYRADVDFGDGDSDTFYSSYQTDNTLKLDNFSHVYNSFSNSISSLGSIKLYYENGGITTLYLEVYKIIDDISPLDLKAFNGQKTKHDEFTFNLIDKNNTLYNFIIFGSDEKKTYTNLNFFNLKNHISSDNIIYSPGAEDAEDNKEYRGREYQNFTNQKSKEKDFDNITLNYTFFDSEFKIGSKDFTAFTMPDNLFPFRKININDTGLAGNGSFAANNPYFSDKVFKLADSNRNNLQNSFLEDEEFLVLQNDVSLFVLQSGDLLGFQSINDLQQNDIFGSYLCTWLKGDGIEEGIWYDRYYIPNDESYTIPFSGQSNIFNSTTQAAEYFKNNGSSLIYYDLVSNLTFEPSASYVYQRINDKQINEYIDSQKDRLLKDTFTITTSSVQLQNIEEINLNNIKGFDNLDIQSIPNRDFNIGFELELDTLSSLNSFQLFGNLYEDGFALKNNFFFTPFIFIPQGNILYIYDNNFKLLRANTYESTANILDVLYIEQNNNFILVCDNKLIKTNYFGEILLERTPLDQQGDNILISEIIKSYKSRTFYGYNNVLIFTNEYITDGPIINLDLNNLVATQDIALNFQLESDPFSASYQSLIPENSGYRFLIGNTPKKLNDEVACSLENVNRFISTQFIPGEAFLGTPLSAILSGGVIEDRSFDQDFFTLIQAYSATNPAFEQFFTFNQDGRARIIFDVIEASRFEDPILDSINSVIYDIGSVQNRLFVQYFNLSASKGFVQEFTPERFKLSAFELSDDVAEGYKLDFIEENNQLKILSFARDLSSNIVVDKINATTGVLEKTYSLPITGIDVSEKMVYIANENIPGTIFTTSPTLSSIYLNGIYINRRFSIQDYTDIINFNGSLTTKFDELSNNITHINPTGYYAIDEKYNLYRDKLVFKFNLNSLLDVKILTEEWNKAGPPLTANGYSSFNWNNPAESLSAWDGITVPINSEDISNVEIIFEVPNLDIKNYFNLDFDLNGGVIRLYNNGIFIGDITFQPNLIPIDKIIYPELFINTQNIRNTPIDNIVTDISYNSKGGILKNLKIHNTSFDTSLINYLELQTKSIDPLYFRIPSATRNKTEEIDTLFNYNIPGNVSNYIKVNIKDISINNDVKGQLKDYLEQTVKVITPSQQKLVYNVD